MATLETISLEIKANAQGAGKEVSNLVHNLRSLAKAAGTAVAALNSLNTVLNKLRGNSDIKFPFVNGTGGNGTGTTASSNSRFMDAFSRSLTKVVGSAGEASGSVGRFGENVRKAGRDCEESTRRTSRYGGVLSQIGRIAKMMVIRTAVRALIKGFQQSWQAAYQFSKQINGTFAKAVDATKTMIADTTTSLIQTFAPVLEALVPVLYTITQAIQWLCQQLQYLMSLLHMTSDLFGASTQQINKYYGSTNKASKSQKNLLASWDELNVIQSKKNGNDGGASYNPGALKSMVGTEINGIMQILVGEGMLAIGAILACTGHFGLGIGCMLIGASAIAKTVTTDWNKLPQNVRETIAKITKYVGAATLALGMILCCTGHIGLGLGLLAMGALNLGIGYSVDWSGDNLVTNVKTVLQKIVSVATGALLAIGVILLCMGNPVGIAFVVASLISFGSLVAMNWDGDLVSSIRATLNQVLGVFEEIWHSIENKAREAWNAITQWWEDSGIGERVRGAWQSVSSYFTELWDDATRRAENAWNSVKCWWEESGIGEKVRGTWNAVSTFFSDLWGNAEEGTGIAGWARTTWNGLETWWNTNVAEAVEKEGAWGGVKAFFSALWSDICAESSRVWESIGDWWNTNVISKISPVWDAVSDFFSTLFGSTEVPGSIAAFANDAWCSIQQWWADNITSNVTTAWDGIKKFFATLFGDAETEGSIAKWASDAWASITTAFTNAVKTLEDAWKGVATWFRDNITVPVENFFIDMINGIVDGLNFVISKLNETGIAHIDLIRKLTRKMTSTEINNLTKNVGYSSGSVDVNASRYAEEMEKRYKKKGIGSNAEGGYGIPSGDLFIANEHGAELVGQIGGKTSVANQQQIVEGIASGVRDANAEQNRLLTQQNELLRSLLDKEWNIEPSAAWGKHNARSAEMWAMVTGR